MSIFAPLKIKNIFILVSTLFILGFSGKAMAVPTITTTATLYGPYCNNVTNTITVLFTYSGTFSDSFRVQISNASGVFPSDFVTGIIGTDTGSPITAVIPIGTAGGTGYRVRVVNPSPTPTFGTNNGSNFTINGNPSVAAISGFSFVQQGGTIALTDGTSGGLWTSSDSLVASVSSSGVVRGVSPGADTINYKVTNICSLSTTVSKAISVIPLPIITSVSPNTGIPGSSITLNGRNFDTAAGHSIVVFGAEKSSVSSITDTSISVTVPTGAMYSPISVADNSTALYAFSHYAFLPTYTNTGLITDSFHFNPSVTFSAASLPIGVAIGDLDGDGKPDIVTVNSGPNNIYVYHNIGSGTGISTGTYASPIILSTGFGPHFVKIADLDGDGRPDIILTNTSTSSNKISIFHNTSTTGTISFATRIDISTGGSAPFDLSVADFDNDGKPDIAVLNQSSGKVAIFKNACGVGSITSTSFGSPVTFSTGAYPYKIFSGDLDGDGKTDIAVSNYGSNTISLFHNTSTSGIISSSTFATATTLTTGTSPTGLAAGDLDGDGKPDLIVTNSGDNTLEVYKNTNSTSGTPSFATGVTFTTGSVPEDLTIGDIDGDGKIDIALGNYTSNTISLYRNTTSGGSITATSFSPKWDMTCGSNPAGIVLGDLDGDGKPEITVVSGGSASFSIFKNYPLPPNSPISGIDSICMGTTTTLTVTTPGGTWVSTNTSIATVNSGGLVSGVAAGLDTIIYYTAAEGDTNKMIFPITINQLTLPATITAPGTIVCLGALLPLSDSVAGGSWSSSAPSIASINAAGYVIGLITGSAVVYYTISNSCATNRDSISISVHPSTGYTIGAITGMHPFCVSSSVTLSDTTAGGSWRSADTTIAIVNSIGSVTGISHGSTSISYGFAGSCGTYFAIGSISIDSVLQADSISGSVDLCPGSSITLADRAGAGGTWSTSNILASVSAAGLVTGITAGIDTIQYSISNSCGTSTGSKIVTIHPIPDAGTISGATAVCVGDTLLLADASPGGAWGTFNADASSLGNGKIRGSIAGTDTVRYILANYCGADTAFYPISIRSFPTAGTISALTSGSLCVGASVTFEDLTSGGIWSCTDSNATISGSVATLVTAGYDTVEYTVTNVCGSAIAKYNIHILDTTITDTIIGASSVCTGKTISLADSTHGGTWSKSNGNISISSSGVVTGAYAGVDTVYYMIIGGCNTVAWKVITINKTPSAGIISSPGSVCVNQSITLVDTVAGGVWSATSHFSTLNDSALTGVTVGSDTVTYTISTSCGLVATTKKITVSPRPYVATIVTNPTMYVGELVTLIDSVAGGTWSLINSNALITPSGKLGALTVGQDTIIYTITNSCGTVKAELPISIFPIHNADAITNVSIYPNPGSGKFTLNLTSELDENITVVVSTSVYKIMNVMTIKTNTPTELDLEYAPEGMYFLSAITSEGWNTVKFVIVK